MSRTSSKPKVYIYNEGKGFVTKVSTNTTDDCPEVVFIRTKVCITPKIKQEKHEEEILSLKQNFNDFSNDFLKKCDGFSDDYIFTCSLAEKSVQFNKKSHLHYDIFLKPKIITNFEDIKTKLEYIFEKLNKHLTILFDKYNLTTV